MKNLSLRALLMVGFLLAALMATASPALADLDAGAGSINDSITRSTDASESTATEDTDTNDGGTAENVEDDGDNAHPSGNDRSVESGGSGTQGSSISDPDDDGRGPERTNGGPDKADGSGGVDKADQDGNNGCGNDDDFEDDNEGRCGKSAGPDNTCSQQGNSGWECSEQRETSATVSGSSTGCPNEKMGGDETGHGANQGSVYDSTCDGSPSGNGRGDGNAKGKPCAGCVGNADDKNPRGQMPGGSDDNSGYECDENMGVGQTNPAHTGCAIAAGASTEDRPPLDDEVQAAVAARSDNACPEDDAARAAEMNEGCGVDDSVLGKVLQRAGPLGTAVKSAASVLGAALPFTGNGDIVAFLVIALALIAGGLFMMKRKSA